jgi:outer membrane protein assembly factor BamB
VRDLNKDGKAEVVVGGGMNTFAVDGQGKPLWTYHDSANKDHQPTMMAIVFADVNNDGVEEPIGGASDMWYLGSMCAIGPKGEKVKEFLGDGWCSGVRVALAEDVLGQGKKSLAYGTRRGGVWFYPDPSDLSKWWYRMLGDQVDALASVRSKDGRKVIAAAGGDTQWVTAFDPSGERAWSVYFDAAVTVMTSNASQDKLYVGCEDGTVYELDPNGRVNRLVTVAGQPKVALAYPTGGVAVGTRDGSLYLVR